MKKNAFTLVELIATITILGVVLLIAVPSYSKHIQFSKDKQCEADKRAIEDLVKQKITEMIYNDKADLISEDCIFEKNNTQVDLDYLPEECKLSNIVGNNLPSELQGKKDNRIAVIKESINGINNWTVETGIKCDK